MFFKSQRISFYCKIYCPVTHFPYFQMFIGVGRHYLKHALTVIAFRLINSLPILPSLLLCRCLLIRGNIQMYMYIQIAEQLTSLIVLFCYLLKLGIHPTSVVEILCRKKEVILRALFSF